MKIKRNRRITAFLTAMMLLFSNVTVYGAEAETETETEANSETEAITETETEAASEMETETETETEAASETETETETETEAASETETETETETEAVGETETETETETKAASETETETETETEAASETETETEVETEAVSETETETETETEVTSETEAETETEAAQLIPETEIETEAAVTQIMIQIQMQIESAKAITLEASPKEVQAVYEATGQKLADSAKEYTPKVASINGEWQILGLVRSGQEVEASVYDKYLENVVNTVKEKKGILHKKKYTEYSRVILALTAMGEDVTNVGGYNLLEPLADFDQTVWQGINGAIFALIALDSHNYEIPVVEEGKTQTTRVKLINHILSLEISGGGWALSGKKADPDVTGMAIQALAPYYEKSEPVKNAVDRAVEKLSELQMDNGGFGSWGVVNSESCSQVIVTLTALGIDPQKDERFIKNGKTVMDALLSYATEDGAFKHVGDGEADQMATEQAYYALTAYQRLQEEKTSLYDMSDVPLASDYQKAAEMDALIETLPVTITLDTEAQVQKALDSYQSLTELQQTLITKENSDKLQEAVKVLEKLKAEQETESETESETQPESETQAGSESEPESETQAGSESEPESETQAESESETEPETEPESEPEIEKKKKKKKNKNNKKPETEEDFQQITEKTPDEEETEEEQPKETEAVKKPTGTTTKVDLVSNRPSSTTTKVTVSATKKEETETETETESESESETETETESETEKETETETEKLSEAVTESLEEQEALRAENHYDEATGIDMRDNEEEILPWYVKLEVTEQLLTDSQAETIKKVLNRNGGDYSFYELRLVNLLDGREWQPEELLRVSIPMTGQETSENMAVVHIKADGTMEFLEGHISVANVEFDTDEFSIFGVIDYDGTWEELMEKMMEEPEGKRIYEIAQIAGPAALVLLLLMLLIRKKKQKVKA